MRVGNEIQFAVPNAGLDCPLCNVPANRIWVETAHAIALAHSEPANTHVDHFAAWARHPLDLGHNSVLADSRCNNRKRGRLPACDHLATWTDGNARCGEQIGKALEEHGMCPNWPRRTGWPSGHTGKPKPHTA